MKYLLLKHNIPHEFNVFYFSLIVVTDKIRFRTEMFKRCKVSI